MTDDTPLTREDVKALDQRIARLEAAAQADEREWAEMRQRIEALEKAVEGLNVKAIANPKGTTDGH